MKFLIGRLPIWPQPKGNFLGRKNRKTCKTNFHHSYTLKIFVFDLLGRNSLCTKQHKPRIIVMGRFGDCWSLAITHLSSLGPLVVKLLVSNPHEPTSQPKHQPQLCYPHYLFLYSLRIFFFYILFFQ